MGKRATQAQVRSYLDLFEGNYVEAAKAIQELVRLDRSAPKRPVQSKRPLSDEIIMHVAGLEKTYKVGKQSIPALAGVTLDVHKGEILALTGPSGSGKSTLLQLMGGLDKPSRGSISVNGVDIGTLSDKRLSVFRNKTIGFIFQFFYLQPFLKLEQNLEVPGMPARTPKKARRERIAELADIVGLSDRLQHFPRELSGGQMQRAAIARALLNNPQVILADEPTGNLDSENGKIIIDLFEKIRDTFGTTIVIVTHDQSVAGRADREVVLKDGLLA